MPPVASVPTVDNHPVQAVPLPAPRHRQLEVLRVGDTGHYLHPPVGRGAVLEPQHRDQQTLGRRHHRLRVVVAVLAQVLVIASQVLGLEVVLYQVRQNQLLWARRVWSWKGLALAQPSHFQSMEN